ncbi:MAG: hypothetical protein LBR62_03415, partial [Puniceicoccales bacterium]|nr:hypothetical protein [Puniceicoccales bacterium]
MTPFENKIVRVVRPFHGLLWLLLAISLISILRDYEPPRSPLYTTESLHGMAKTSGRWGYLGLYL